MRVLYGVVGEGMGHATRSRVLLEHLLAAGHTVRVVVSGRAYQFLSDKFAGRTGISVDQIHGLHLKFEGNDLDVTESLLSNLELAPEGIRRNLEVYKKVVADFDADVVVSDFESWAYFFGRSQGIPVISVDNMQIINRCLHDRFVTDDKSFSFRLARLAVKSKLPGAYHYLVTSFFFPRVRKPRTTLLPPILRPEILASRREAPRNARDSHVLVYQTANANADGLLAALRSLPYRFKVYGLGRTGTDGNVTLAPFSETGFVDDLRTARAVVAGGGFSLMGECVHLHVPLLAAPIRGQYEQELNARYLQSLGYGAFTEVITAEVIQDFLQRTDAMSHALESYVPRDNGMLLRCLDELLRGVSLDEPPPPTLQSPALGKYEPRLPTSLADAISEEGEPESR